MRVFMFGFSFGDELLILIIIAYSQDILYSL